MRVLLFTFGTALVADLQLLKFLGDIISFSVTLMPLAIAPAVPMICSIGFAICPYVSPTPAGSLNFSILNRGAGFIEARRYNLQRFRASCFYHTTPAGRATCRRGKRPAATSPTPT